MHKFAT